ncbi:hypothetical protein EI94DRAFT_1704817 [Lactarius quietus]|nr:hypothetical protein EI94DRAFT_1704817 [Lactarius quietus]
MGMSKLSSVLLGRRKEDMEERGQRSLYSQPHPTGNTLATKAIKANDNLAPSNKANKSHNLVLLHKATLQELVHARNRAVIHVLFERTACCMRAPGGKDVLFCNVTKPKGLRMPLDISCQCCADTLAYNPQNRGPRKCRHPDRESDTFG